MADTGLVHETRFNAAVKVIQSLPKNGSFQPSHEMMLKFYSFYKQATQGPCNIPRPGFWDQVGRYKWDAWSGLGDMSKDEAMISYVEEMKKILESMPVNEKVEELLQVIGPFYEIVEDKKHARGPALTSELGTVLTSTPNCKAVNGKAESSDSGAESEDDGEKDEKDEQVEVVRSEEEIELTEIDESIVELEPSVDDDLDNVLPNGLNNLESSAPVLYTDNQTKSALNGTSNKEIVQENKLNIESLDIPDASTDKDAEEEHLEDISGMHHLTSDSDSEVFCDSMEQFGQEETTEFSLSTQLGNSTYLLKVDHGHLMENSTIPDNNIVTLMHSGVESTIEASVERKGEVKDGGEDGKPSGRAPHKEKVGSDRMENCAPRRGRGSRLQPPSGGAQGWQTGGGGGGDDGEHWGSERGPSLSLNEQIATVLMRLQEDMQSVLQRLHTLEALTATQARAISVQSSDQPVFHSRKKWWPFDMSPGTLAFAVLWPFVAQWLVHVYLQRRRRKLN